MLGSAYRSCFREGWRHQRHGQQRHQVLSSLHTQRPMTTKSKSDCTTSDQRPPAKIHLALPPSRIAPTLRQDLSGFDQQRRSGEKDRRTDSHYAQFPSIPLHSINSDDSPEKDDSHYHQYHHHRASTAFGSRQLSPRQQKLLKQAIHAARRKILQIHAQTSTRNQTERMFSNKSSSDDGDELNETIKSLSQSSYPRTTPNRPASLDDATLKPTIESVVEPVVIKVKEETNSSNEPSKTKKKLRKAKRMLVPNYGPDSDQALKSLQDARKEKANAKTEANVRRALYGNLLICAAKLGAWISSGSSSMMSEFVHSVVDCGNQSLLLMGLRDSRNAADRHHPYGYGKSVYFWALVSALGTFFLGAGVSMTHSIGEVMNPSLQNISWEVWSVLGASFVIDGYVLYKTFSEIREGMPPGVSFWKHVQNIRDPATLAVLLEDGAACLGVVIAIAGITAAHATDNPVFDGMAGVGISCLLGTMGLVLVRVNHRFLLGQGVDREMTERIEQIILNRGSIDNVYSVQSQWTGPETFSFKAEVDFDGTFLAAQLMPRYQGEFKQAQSNLDDELEVLLCWYAEDVMRAVEREVRYIEAQIRAVYPGAEYIELEPMSRDADKFAIDDSFEEKLHMIEKEEVKSMIRVLYQNDPSKGMPTLDNIPNFGYDNNNNNAGDGRKGPSEK